MMWSSFRIALRPNEQGKYNLDYLWTSMRGIGVVMFC